MCYAGYLICYPVKGLLERQVERCCSNAKRTEYFIQKYISVKLKDKEGCAQSTLLYHIRAQ